MSRAGLSVQSLSVLYELINVLSLYLVQGRAQHFQNIRLFAFFATAFHPRLRYLAVAWVARFGLRSHVMFFFLVFWDSALSHCFVSTPPTTLVLKLRGGVGGKGGRMIRGEIWSETNLIEHELCRGGK